LAAIAAVSLLEYDVTNLAHVYLGSFSLQILSSSVQLNIAAQLFLVSLEIQRLVPKPLLHCLGCVLKFVVLLKSETSPQSEDLSALEQVFIKDLFILCSILTSLPVPAAEKHPHSMILPPPCFTVGMVQGFLYM
jgi:hypothetical protein